jgi:putative tryptophan/tyrosine transport system substrate-binding protein
MARMSRRQFVVGAGGLGLLAGCGRLPWQAAPAAQVRRVGYLTGGPFSPATEANLAVFREGLHDLGYVEGDNLLIQGRYPSGADQLAEPAADLVGLQPEVILALASTVARALQAATSTIPIVSTGGGGDLVATGVAASHARPGGNVTGLSTPPLAGKQLQLLQDAVPTLSRVLVLFDATNSTFGRYFEREPIEEAARVLGLELQFAGIRDADELERAFEAAARERADGLFTSLGPLILANQVRIAELALRSRLPSMWQISDAVERGGLMGYGPNRAGLYRRAAYYVDRILKGAKPADLPVEQPMTFDFVVNLKTARELGITFPNEIMLQVTEVIE